MAKKKTGSMKTKKTESNIEKTGHAESDKGVLYRIAGPVVVAKGIRARMYDVVRVGKEKLMGEVIQVTDDKTVIQVYEDTSGIKPGEEVSNTGTSLSVELGPGLLTSIYDGIQRPLPVLQKQMGDFIKRGVDAPGLDQKKKWEFKAVAKKGDNVKEGDILGEVEETTGFMHRIMVPPKIKGKITDIKSGSFTVNDTIAVLDGKHNITMKQKWPVRNPRPCAKKLAPEIPLRTGQRIFDVLFPLAKGGTAAIPGPFGAGKCVTGDTPLFVGNELKTIKEVFEEAESNIECKKTENKYETIIELSRPLKIQTFSKDKIEEWTATHVYKGKTSQIVEIATRSGRKARLTPIHKLFKVDGSLNVVETEAQRLREGDYIVSPRKIEIDSSYKTINIDFACRITEGRTIDKIPSLIDKYCEDNNLTKKQLARMMMAPYHDLINFYKKRNTPTLYFAKKIFSLANEELDVSEVKTERRSKTIKLPRILSEELAELLGYLMSDGMVKGSASIHFFNKKKELRERASYLINKLFNLDTKEYYARTVEAVAVSSRPLVKFLVSLGYPLAKKSRNVRVPQDLFSSPESVVKSFLKAYISCDGHIGKREVEIATASREMMTGLSYLLLRIGVLYRTRKKTVNKRKYYRVFISPREAIKISDYYNKSFYFNSTDIVPMTSGLFRQILGETKPYELEKKGLSTAAYYVNQNQTACMFQKIITSIGASNGLKTFANALEYVFCDKVTSVRVINKETDVYDITVPDTHNFVGGSVPMILHNTVSQQQLAKWSDADVIVYIGCGERGNEMTEVLTEFPHLKDPKTGRPLMNRTVLIANTSNMPVAAREASVYTGITIAEYFRDMGYSVALMADSTSRWAEAMREISSRLEEMPGEEGYPAYLSTRLAEFYERAGRIIPLGTSRGKEEGSVTIIGAVSPPGGDFSEPVTQGTLRVTKTFWALDAKLAQRRHFPSINWLTSYSLYLDVLEPWFAKNIAADWRQFIDRCMTILQEEDKLMEIVQLVGSDALPEKEQLTLEVARMIREFMLQQNAYHEVDTYCSLEKSYLLMKTILHFSDLAANALNKGARMKDISQVKSKDRIADAKFTKDHEKLLNDIQKQMNAEFDRVIK